MLIQDVKGAIPLNQTGGFIEPDEVFFPDQDADDVAAVKLVMQDIQKAEGFMNSRLYVRDWNLADILFYAQVKPETWQGTNVARASLGMPIVAEHLFSILAACMQALFPGTSPVELEPYPSTATELARAEHALVDWGFEVSNFKFEIRKMAFEALLYGTGAGFWGWKQQTITRKQYKLKEQPQVVGIEQGTVEIPSEGSNEIESVDVKEKINQPCFEYSSLRWIRVDSGCRQPNGQGAKWVSRVLYLTADELDGLRDCEGYKNIPSREEFAKLTTPSKEAAQQNQLEMQTQTSFTNYQQTKALPQSFETTADPLRQPFRVDEYWTPDRVLSILQGQLCIRNERHPFGRIPAVFTWFQEAPDSFFSLGLGNRVGNYQRMAQGVVNLYLDDLSLNLNQMYVGKRGFNNLSQQIWSSPGKVIYADDEFFKPLQRNPMGVDALTAIANAQDWAQRISGANEMSVQGTMPSNKSSITRTGTGASILAQGASMRLQFFVDQTADHVIIPVAEGFMDMFPMYMTPSEVKKVLSDEMGEAWAGDPVALFNGRYKLRTLAGSKLQQREALKQGLPFLYQFLESPAIQQAMSQQKKKSDFLELTKMIFTATGAPHYQDIIKDMTEEDVKQMMAMQPGVQQQQMEQQKLQAAGTLQSQKIEDSAMGRVFVKMMEKLIEKGVLDPNEFNPGTAG